MSTSDGALSSLPPPPTAYRLTIFKVTSYIVFTQRKGFSKVGSVAELELFYKSVRTHNLVAGWWSWVGLIWTPMTLSANKRALSKLREISVSGFAAPGWFVDPTGRNGERFWDGSKWTDQLRVIETDGSTS